MASSLDKSIQFMALTECFQEKDLRVFWHKLWKHCNKEKLLQHLFLLFSACETQQFLNDALKAAAETREKKIHPKRT